MNRGRHPQKQTGASAYSLAVRQANTALEERKTAFHLVTPRQTLVLAWLPWFRSVWFLLEVVVHQLNGSLGEELFEVGATRRRWPPLQAFSWRGEVAANWLGAVTFSEQSH